MKRGKRGSVCNSVGERNCAKQVDFFHLKFVFLFDTFNLCLHWKFAGVPGKRSWITNPDATTGCHCFFKVFFAYLGAPSGHNVENFVPRGHVVVVSAWPCVCSRLLSGTLLE